MFTQLHDWQNFYLLAGGASATLVGLMFVAISLGSGLYAPEHLPSLARALSPTFIHFVYVLVTAIVALAPTITATVLGVLLVFVGLGSLGYTVSRLPSSREAYRKREIDQTDLLWYILLPSVVYVLYCDAGIGLLKAGLRGERPSHALDLLASASILLVVIGVRNAWDLVVWMVLRRAERPQ